jgi:hypothetical protein
MCCFRWYVQFFRECRWLDLFLMEAAILFFYLRTKVLLPPVLSVYADLKFRLLSLITSLNFNVWLRGYLIKKLQLSANLWGCRPEI